MDDVEIGPGDLAAGRADRRQDLLVNPPVEPQVRPVAEQLDVIDDRHVGIGLAVLAAARTMDLHDEPQHVRRDLAIDQPAEPAAALGRDRVVGVHPEQPVAARVPQRLVARGREIVAPGEMEQPAAERLDDPRRLVDRAGVDDHHLVDPGPDALQAGRQASGPSRGRSCRARAAADPASAKPQAPAGANRRTARWPRHVHAGAAGQAALPVRGSPTPPSSALGEGLPTPPRP